VKILDDAIQIDQTGIGPVIHFKPQTNNTLKRLCLIT